MVPADDRLQLARFRLGEHLKALRTANGLTLRAVGDRVGKSEQHLSNIERGKGTLAYECVAALDSILRADGSLLALKIAEEAIAKERDVERRGLATQPVPSSKEGLSRYPLAGDRTEFVMDVTASGQVFSPGREFHHTWRLRNAGDVPWVARWLARQGPAAAPSLLWSEARVPIATTYPGQEVDITVKFRAAIVEGTTQAHFKMEDDSGYLFFPDRHYYGVMVTATTTKYR